MGVPPSNRPAPTSANPHERNLRIAEFNGEIDVEGWFETFEITCDSMNGGMGVGDKAMKSFLIGAMKDQAQGWLLGLKGSLRAMSYGQLKAQLIEHFAGEVVMHVRDLEDLKQGNKPLSKHNREFAKLAAAASSDMTLREKRDRYLESIHPKISESLASVGNLPLQQLMARALDVNRRLKPG